MTTTRMPAVMMAGMSSAKGRALGALGAFWGAEYWLLRQQHGDPSYLEAFARILDQASEDGC
jgi:hypothetical protein